MTLDEKFQNRNSYSAVSEDLIPFRFGSATIEEDQKPVLNQIAEAMRGNTDAVLVLEGRTDATGDPLYNIRLGERRLDSVLRYLVVDREVPMHRVHKMSFGEDRPVASNDTTEGRAQNRSVVLRVLVPNLNSGSGTQITSGVSNTGR